MFLDDDEAIAKVKREKSIDEAIAKVKREKSITHFIPLVSFYTL